MNVGSLWINCVVLTCIVTRGYDDLSANKNAQQYKTPIGCATCTAINVVDRNAHTCARMEEIGITSLDKSTWWYVDLGGRYNVYNIRIQFKDYGGYTMRQRGRFAGFSVYVSNTTDRHSGYLCYKDGTALPPLDFNTNCITNGRYVIFYNERKDGITYPVGYETQSVYSELCEVYVLGCVRLGVYGSNCDKLCTDDCPEPRCNIFNGACYSCAPGWIGDFCRNDCPSGTFGQGCLNNCSGHCVNDATCNRSTGSCDQGCQSGYVGEFCEKASSNADEFDDNSSASFYIAGLPFVKLIIIIFFAILV